MMEGRCKLNGACARLYMPLAVSFGKTMHSFQGSSVGKTQPGRPDNAYHPLVGDPGTRNFEANNPGLFYTLLSRATTLGEEGKLETFAIFFKRTNISHERIEKITCKQGKEKGVYKKIEDLRKWVAYLKGNTMCRSKDVEVEDIIGWIDSAIENLVPSQTLAKWVGDVLNMYFNETIYVRVK